MRSYQSELTDDVLVHTNNVKGFVCKVQNKKKEKNQVEITLPLFPTHLQISKEQRAKYDQNSNLINKNAVGKPKYEKLSGNKIYSGNISKHTRNKLVKELKLYLDRVLGEEINNYLKNNSSYLINKKIKIEYNYYVPKNYGSISLRNNIIYITNKYVKWDISNLAYIYNKIITDYLVDKNVLKDDSIEYVVGESTNYYEVAHFYSRYLSIQLLIVDEH